MILGMQSLRKIRAKTDNRCAICGKQGELGCVPFIPQWTRVNTDIRNYIPMCDDCIIDRKMQFVEIGKLKYLKDESISELMSFYNTNAKFIKEYTRRFGKQRTMGLVDIDYALRILSSYDTFIENNHQESNKE